MIANAIDHLLTNVLIAVLSLEPSPLLEPVIATLDPSRKIEILKSRANHIINPAWKKSVTGFCDKAESVYKQRNIVCHTLAFLEGETWKFKPVAAVKLLNKLDLENMVAAEFPFNDIKAAITTGEAAFGAGASLLQNFARSNAELARRRALKSQAAPPDAATTIAAIRAAIHPKSPFEAADFEQIERLLQACLLVLEHDAHPGKIKRLLTGFRNGYGDWLDPIRDAILTAAIPDEERSQVQGAFEMACAFLFDIQGHNDRPEGTPRPNG
jgi:hypothetical protein